MAYSKRTIGFALIIPDFEFAPCKEIRVNPPVSATNTSTILIIKGQGIGPECIEAAQVVLAATGPLA